MVLEAVKRGCDLSNIPPEFLDDKEIVSLCLKRNAWSFIIVEDDLRNDRELVMEAIRCGCPLSQLNREFIDDKEIILLAINVLGGENIRYADDRLKSDNDCVTAALASEPSALRYLGHEFRSNRSLVMNILQDHGFLYDSIADELKGDKEILLIALQSSFPDIFMYASAELRADREVVLEAVKINGDCLRHASIEFQNDFEVVMEAVKSQGCALRFASADLRNNFQVCQVAIYSNPTNYHYIGPVMKKNRELAMQAIDLSSVNYKYMDDSLKQDEELAWLAVSSSQSYGLNVTDFDEIFQRDRSIMLEFMKRHPYQHQFELLWKPFRSDMEFIMPCLCSDGNTLQHVPIALKKDRELVKTAIRAGLSYEHLTMKYKQDKDIILLFGSKRNGLHFYSSLNDELQNDIEVIKCALKSGVPFSFIPKELQKDKNLAMIALKHDVSNYKYLLSELASDREFILDVAARAGTPIIEYGKEWNNDKVCQTI